MQPTSDQNVLYESACELFEEVWTGEPVRLLGIRTAKLVDEKEPMQLSHFLILKSQNLWMRSIRN